VWVAHGREGASPFLSISILLRFWRCGLYSSFPVLPHCLPPNTHPQALRIMATSLALTTLRILPRAALSYRPSSSTASSMHSSSTTSSSSSSPPALFALLATAAAAGVAATSLSSSSQCEVAQSEEEEGGEGEAMKEATATASATSAPSFSEHHDRVDTKLHRAYPEFLKVSDWWAGGERTIRPPPVLPPSPCCGPCSLD